MRLASVAFVLVLFFSAPLALPEGYAQQSRIADGALHLYGERGILGLLQREGYRVTRVY